jgi:NADH-ubiquinone oxidoreductase chain 1
LVEVGRLPYDFYEGESELVSGFSVEYGSVIYMIIFLFEYIDLIFICIFSSYIYFYGIFCFIFYYFFIFFCFLVRGYFIRFRYDKVIIIMWKIIFLIIFNYFFYFFCLKSFVYNCFCLIFFLLIDLKVNFFVIFKITLLTIVYLLVSY